MPKGEMKMENYIETRTIGVNVWGPTKFFNQIITCYKALARKYDLSYTSKTVLYIPFLHRKMQFIFIGDMTEKYALKIKNEIEDLTNQCFGKNVIRVI